MFIAEKYVKKGNKLYIEGKISSRTYEQDGVTKYFYEIVGNNFQMLDGKPSEQGASGAQPSAATQPSNSTTTDTNSSAPDEKLPEDDLPF